MSDNPQKPLPMSSTTDAFPWGAGHGTLRLHAQVSRQAKHYAHKGINTLVSCEKAFQNPCHSEMTERKYVQQHIRICTHGVKTGLRVRASQDNRHSIPTRIPIPGPTLSVAGGGGGSNITHALLSPDPETLPKGEVSRPATGEFSQTKSAPRPTDSGSLCSLRGRSQLHSEREIWPRHYPSGVGS